MMQVHICKFLKTSAICMQKQLDKVITRQTRAHVPEKGALSFDALYHFSPVFHYLQAHKYEDRRK